MEALWTLLGTPHNTPHAIAGVLNATANLTKTHFLPDLFCKNRDWCGRGPQEMKHIGSLGYLVMNSVMNLVIH